MIEKRQPNAVADRLAQEILDTCINSDLANLRPDAVRRSLKRTLGGLPGPLIPRVQSIVIERLAGMLQVFSDQIQGRLRDTSHASAQSVEDALKQVVTATQDDELARKVVNPIYLDEVSPETLTGIALTSEQGDHVIWHSYRPDTISAVAARMLMLSSRVRHGMRYNMTEPEPHFTIKTTNAPTASAEAPAALTPGGRDNG